MTQAEVVTELVHERSGFGVSEAPGRRDPLRRLAAECDHEVVTGQLGDAGGRRRLCVAVAEHGVVEGGLPRREERAASRARAFCGRPEESVAGSSTARLDVVEVVGRTGSARQEPRGRDRRHLLAERRVQVDPGRAIGVGHGRGGECSDGVGERAV